MFFDLHNLIGYNLAMSAEKDNQNPLLRATLGYKEAMGSEEKLGTTLDGLLEEISNLPRGTNESIRAEALGELFDTLRKYRQAVDNMKIASVAWGQLALNQVPTNVTPEPAQNSYDTRLNGFHGDEDTKPLRPVRIKKIEEPPVDSEATVVGKKAISTLPETEVSSDLRASLPQKQSQQIGSTAEADQTDISYPDVIFTTRLPEDTQPLISPIATPKKHWLEKMQIIDKVRKIRNSFPKIQIKVTKRK